MRGLYELVCAADGCARPGERVAVLGIGALGHLALQFSKACGFETVAITRTDDKHDLARKLGADLVVSSCDELSAAGGADVVLATGRSYPVAAQALRCLRPEGRLVLAGMDTSGSFTIAPDNPFFVQRQRVLGSTHNGLQYLQEALALVASGKVTPMVEVFPMADIPNVIDRVEKGDVRFRAVVTY